METAITLIGSLVAMFYLAPTVVAVFNDKPNITTICGLNVLFGWTGVGWIFAMLMALNLKDDKPKGVATKGIDFDKLEKEYAAKEPDFVKEMKLRQNTRTEIKNKVPSGSNKRIPTLGSTSSRRSNSVISSSNTHDTTPNTFAVLGYDICSSSSSSSSCDSSSSSSCD